MQRREALKTIAGAGLAGWLGDLGPLGALSRGVADDAQVTPDIVRFDASMEPLVRLIEETPRGKCIEMAAEQLRRGTPYRNLLGALYLAGIRNVNPQPPGFKFHCVFVIHAAHQLSLNAPVEDRLLPLFWALDNFKLSQAQDVEQGDFRLKPVNGSIPSAAQAGREFHAAMEDWDEERADRAIVGLVRSRGANEIIEGLWRYGARDYRNIGHKAIFVANTWRTLQTIGWRHAEPALRSLVLGLLDFGAKEQVNDYAFEDQSYLANLDLVQASIDDLPDDWTVSEANPDATRQLLDGFRTAEVNDSCRAALQELKAGAKAQAVWDAVHLWAGELMMRQPGIYGIHTVTSVNGLRYAYETAADPETRLVVLLQGIGWMGQFQRFMSGRNNGLSPVVITECKAAKTSDDPQAAAEEVLQAVGVDTPAAAAKAMTLADRADATGEFSRDALRLIFRKGTDAHDYKYAAAVLEDLELVSRVWRPHMLATAVYHLPGATAPASPLMEQAAEAVHGI
jgi:hypothetical protein